MIRALIPDGVNAGGFLLLSLVGVVLPIFIIKTARRVRGRPLPVSRSSFFRQTILFQLFLGAICAWTASTHRILAMPLPQRPVIAWSAAGFMYFVAVLMLKLRWPSRSAVSKQWLYDILPHDRAELPPYVLLCAVAGVVEEFIYRGVMTELAQRLIGVAIVTIVAMSIAFAAAHAMQGLRSMAAIFIIALACHALVWLAQSLIPAMAVHFAYDLTAGMLIPRWFESAAR